MNRNLSDCAAMACLPAAAVVTMALPKGTVLRVKATFDNSADNPLNPNSPPKPVRLGEQTTNEMCFVFLGATSDGPGRSPFSRPNLAAFRR